MPQRQSVVIVALIGLGALGPCAWRHRWREEQAPAPTIVLANPSEVVLEHPSEVVPARVPPVIPEPAPAVSSPSPEALPPPMAIRAPAESNFLPGRMSPDRQTRGPREVGATTVDARRPTPAIHPARR